jgi:hypothetical protein
MSFGLMAVAVVVMFAIAVALMNRGAGTRD